MYSFLHLSFLTVTISYSLRQYFINKIQLCGNKCNVKRELFYWLPLSLIGSILAANLISISIITIISSTILKKMGRDATYPMFIARLIHPIKTLYVLGIFFAFHAFAVGVYLLQQRKTRLSIQLTRRIIDTMVVLYTIFLLGLFFVFYFWHPFKMSDTV